MTTPTSDTAFKWTQLLVTTVFGGLLAAGGSIYLGQRNTQIEIAKIAQERERLAQAEREFQVRQKDTEVELAAKMFGLLMERYLDQKTVAARLVTLRLLALNFADVPINLRPIFEDLEARLPDARQKERLRAIAREVARRQAFRLAARDGDLQDFEDVVPGSERSIANTSFLVHVTSVQEDGVRLELVEGNRRIGPFSVTSYDWPLVDNTKFGEQRLAVMLLAVKGGKASVRIINFPSSLAPDRIDLKELGRDRSLTNY